MEDNALYEVNDSLPESLSAFARHPSALTFDDDNYQPPTPELVSHLIRLTGWSDAQTAALIGVQYSPRYGSQTLRKYRAPTSSKDYRPIHFPTWRLLLGKAGVVGIL